MDDETIKKKKRYQRPTLSEGALRPEGLVLRGGPESMVSHRCSKERAKAMNTVLAVRLLRIEGERPRRSIVGGRGL